MCCLYSATLQFRTQQKPVSPRDCGLAIAIPLDENGFAGKLGREAEGNFIQTFCAERMNLSAHGLWSLYEPYAKYAQEVAARAARIGVSVVLDATLADFSSLLSTCEVVTLVAHWKGALFKPADIADPAETVSQLLNPDSRLSQALRQLSPGSVLPPPATDRGAVAQLLNQFLLDGLPIPGSSGSETRLGVISRFHNELSQRRQPLELAGHFLGGPSVEFNEGFHGLSTIVASVPLEFTGLLDLTVCNSVLLAETIRRSRPRCFVLANENLAFLDFRLAVYAEVLRSLDRSAEPYDDAVYRIRKELKEVADEWSKGGARPLHRFRSAFWRRN